MKFTEKELIERIRHIINNPNFFCSIRGEIQKALDYEKK